ncbi:ATP-binding protein [Lachnospira multipara]|uniref:Circadian input-output histidine kinase CikA n=1 Tax=Lachnospira multipara TaxID=28051 RepID=A0A1H5UG89_9FIRM|nr:ATP-binding protein [Lachnospira multipara]SEF74075.1 Signal transduction histidine kinase [Lachnospira multipara]
MDFILRYPRISYEMVAIIFDSIIIIFSWNQSLRHVKTAKAFKATAISCLLLVLSEVSLPYILELDSSFDLLKAFVDSIQFFFAVTTMYNFSRYMEYYTLSNTSKIIIRFNILVLIVSLALIISNPFTYLLDYYDSATNTFVNQEFYIIIGYLPAMYFSIYSMYVYVRGFKKMYNRERVAFIITFIMSLLGAIAQPLLHGQLKIIGLFSSFGLFILYLSLETRDYTSLSKTMNELKEANETAQNANRAKSSFLANMSHEIRTPMNAMLGINEIIINSTKEENVSSYANDMKVAGNSLLHIINDVLDISKIEAGKLEIVETEYHLTELLDELKFTYGLKAQMKNLDFIFDIDEDLPDLLIGDESHLRQILSNILSNAIKFTKTGEVRFSAFGIKSSTDIKFTFVVSDTGIGIKEEDLPYLFESFKRVDMENTRNIEGTGLGLSITKRLLDNMDGEISVRSSYGDGTIITIKVDQFVADDLTIREYRKVLRENFDAEEDKKLKTTPNLKGMKLLIVDDNDINIKVATAFFELTGASIFSFNDSLEALKDLQKNKYDLIFLDDLMPKLSGPGLLKRLRGLTTCPNNQTPVVIMTANTNVEDKANYSNMGFDGFLAKPMQMEEVNELLNTLIS